MQYVYVEPDIGHHSKYINIKNNNIYSALNVKLAGNALVSLIKAFEPNNFGLHTLPATMKQIKNYHEKVIQPNKAKLYLDSGGYSYIKGAIDPNFTLKMIGCYAAYIENYHKTFDYVFSLDIPFNAKHKEYNEYNFLNRMNYESLKKTVKAINKIPKLKQKFFFVHQFKIKEQYEIWSDLYNDEDLGLHKLPIHRAIGGLVSISKKNKISFNASIGIAYKCLYDYLKYMDNYSPDNKHKFRLHFLGINRYIDRFISAFLEKLFARYFKELKYPKPVVSYDSIDYCVTAMNSPRTMKILQRQNKEIICYNSITDVPEDTLKEIYESSNDGIHKNIDLLNKAHKMEDSYSMIPLNIYSNLEMDRYLENVIDRSKLVNVFYTNDTGEIANTIIEVCENLKKTSLHHYVPKNFFKILKENLNIINHFNNWFKTDRTSKRIEILMHHYIEALKTQDKIKKE